MNPTRRARSTIARLVGPAVAGWLATMLLLPISTVAGQEITGVYRDGRLVDTLEGVEQFKEQVAKLRAEYRGHPSVSSPDAARRGAAWERQHDALAALNERIARAEGAAGGLGPEDRAEMSVLLSELRAARRQVRGHLSQTREGLVAAGVDEVILQRHDRSVSRLGARLDRIETAVGSVASGDDEALNDAVALLESPAATGKTSMRAESAPPNEPVAVASAALAPMLTPEEARQGRGPPAGRGRGPSPPAEGGAPPGPGDLAETPEVRFTQGINERADGLATVDELYKFVRNRFDFEPYRGSRKGADFALVQERGNDVDQASCLIAMLRHLGHPARYVRGTVEADAATVANWLGVDDPAVAANILATAGLDGAGILGPGSEVVAIRFTHVWVETHVPYSNYRGFPADTTGRTWVALAPAFKGRRITPGEDLLTPMGFDKTTFRDDFITSGNPLTPLEQVRNDMQAFLDANQPGRLVGDIERCSRIDRQKLGLLPASLPFRVRSINSRFSELEDDQRHKIRFHIHHNGTDYIDHTALLSDLAGHRVTTEYVGATPADQGVIDLHGGLFNTPTNLVKVVPVIKVDDAPIASPAGSPPGLDLLQETEFHLDFITPAGVINNTPTVDNLVAAGPGQGLVFNTFNDRHDTFVTASSFPPERFLESLLVLSARQYQHNTAIAAEALQKLTRTVSLEEVRPIIVGSLVRQVGFELIWNGLCLDADRRIMNPFAVDGDPNKKLNHNLLLGMNESVEQHRLFETIFGEDTVATIKVLQLAHSQGIPICTITSDIDTECPGFSHPASVRDTVNSIIAGGHEVIIPRDPIVRNDFEGTGLIDLDPTTCDGQYTITGTVILIKKKEANGLTTLAVWAGGFDPAVRIVDVSAAVNMPAANSVFFADDRSRVTIEIVFTLQRVDGNGMSLPNQILTARFSTHKTIRELGPGNFDLSVADLGDPVTSPFTITRTRIQPKGPFVLQNDRPVVVQLTTDPPVPDQQLSTMVKRFDRSGSIWAASQKSLTVLDQDGDSDLNTDASGNALLTLTAGFAGQGRVALDVPGSVGDLVCDVTEACKDCCGKTVLKPYSGEFRAGATDLAIPGRGMDFRISRTHRTQGSHFGPAGSGDFAKGWCVSYVDDRICPDGDNIVVIRSDVRSDTFVGKGLLAPQECFDQLIKTPGGDYELRDPQGTVCTYKDPADPDIPGRLIRCEDRDGNFISFLYNQPAGLSKHVLVTAVDTMGRNIGFSYFPDSDPNPGRRGRVESIVDFYGDNGSAGRTVSYDYDSDGQLVRATGPSVVGTPTGNDFPTGRTTRYKYLTPADLPAGLTTDQQQRLVGNLSQIFAPNEVGNTPDTNPPDALARHRVVYGMDPDDEDSFDRALLCTEGGTNSSGVPAGGTRQYLYHQIASASPTPNDPFLQVTETDRRGNVEINTYSAWDTRLERREQTRGVRNGEPAEFVTRHAFDTDKHLTRTIRPLGNITEYTFDTGNPDRSQQGNLTGTLVTPDARGGDQSTLATGQVYEPVYQQLAASTDPRGLDAGFVPPIADTAGRTQPERYTTRFLFDFQEGDAATVVNGLAEELNTDTATVQAHLAANGIALGLGDLNGDGITSQTSGNVVRVEQPAASLLAGSKQATIEGDLVQEVVTLYRYNALGQRIAEVDPEGNVHRFSYFPETDPDGDGTASPAPADGRTPDASTGGYLSDSIRDDSHLAGANNGNGEPPTQIRTSYTYDDAGKRTSITDGRGVRTDFVLNELGETVRVSKAADVSGTGSANPPEPLSLVPFGFLEVHLYDFNGNLVGVQTEDRGDTSNTGGFVDQSTVYDILDQPVQVTREVAVGQSLVTEFRYDANGNRVLERLPDGNANASTFDERDLLYEQIEGILGPPTDALGPPGGPYDPFGGTPSKITYNYDPNTNRIEVVDAADTDGSAGNNSSIAGAGDAATLTYDGFDREVRMTDPTGNTITLTYDPNGNVVGTLRQGPVGGPSPTDNSGTGNVNLGQTLISFDELNREIERQRALFIPTGTGLLGSPSLAEGPLSPGDGAINTRFEYDRKGRRTCVIEDDLDIFLSAYDGADRRVNMLDAEGNLVRVAYDDNDQMIETEETDVSQVPGVANEVFVTTFHYDSLGRLQQKIDNLGQTQEFRYDSRGNLVAHSDASGPPSGATIARRRFPGGPLTVNSINGPGNVTVCYYDGQGRKVAEQEVLTSSGQGDGTNVGADIFGVKGALPIPDGSQGGGDGLVTRLSSWSGNSLRTSLTDDNGNRTIFSYDNLNRLIAETQGAVFPPALADRDDPDTTILHGYDPDHNRTRTIDENGSVIDCSYDASNRRTACDITRAAGVVGTTEQRFEYDGLSRLTRCTDNNEPGATNDDSTVTFAYDSLGRTLEETQAVAPFAAKVISSSYESQTRSRLDYPNGRSVGYTYDSLDRLRTVRDLGAGTDIADYDYIGVDRVLERAFPLNGTRLTHLDDAGTSDIGYDGMRRPVRLRHLDALNSLLVGFDHAFDREHHKLYEEKLHDLGNSELYDYDSIYRLTRFDRGTLTAPKDAIAAPTPLADAVQAQDWTLDGSGNWKQVDTTVGGVTTPEARQHSSFNELIDRAGITIDHDNNGNTVDDGVVIVDWDAYDRIRRMVRGSDSAVIANYAYDALGRRIRKTVSNGGLPNDASLNGITNYLHDGLRVIEERTGADVIVQQHVFGRYLDEPLVLDRNLDGDGTATGGSDERLFFHQNTLYSTFGLTDSAGNLLERYLYDAYGRPAFFDGSGVLLAGANRSAVGNPFLFTGRRLDPESRLYHYRHRFLDPGAGRFTSRDPWGGWLDLANLGNAYAYAGNRPHASLDPLGTMQIRDFNPNYPTPPTKQYPGAVYDMTGHATTHVYLALFDLYNSFGRASTDSVILGGQFIGDLRKNSEFVTIEKQVAWQLESRAQAMLGQQQCDEEAIFWDAGFKLVLADLPSITQRLALGMSSLYWRATCNSTAKKCCVKNPSCPSGFGNEATYSCRVDWTLYDVYDFKWWELYGALGTPFYIFGDWQTTYTGTVKECCQGP